MGHAHLEALTKVLRTPLSQLMCEVENPQVGLGAPALLLQKSTPLRSIVPAGAHPATFSHAKATILALRALEDARNWLQTSHRVA
jgi:hypothetical protein